MTNSPTPTELLALRTANAALLTSRDAFCDIAATIVFALGSAQLLQSPETALQVEVQSRELSAALAELKTLRARVAELEAQGSRVRTDELRPGDRVWHPYDIVRFTVDAPAETLSPGIQFHNRVTDQFESGMRVTGTDDRGETVLVDTAPSYLWFREDSATELERLRARVAELEGATCAHCSGGHAPECPYGECPSCGAPADATGTRIPLHRVGCPLDVPVVPAEARQLEDPHESPLHHEYALGHDLPARADLPESLR